MIAPIVVVPVAEVLNAVVLIAVVRIAVVPIARGRSTLTEVVLSQGLLADRGVRHEVGRTIKDPVAIVSQVILRRLVAAGATPMVDQQTLADLFSLEPSSNPACIRGLVYLPEMRRTPKRLDENRG